jgi:hypothetical protein
VGDGSRLIVVVPLNGGGPPIGKKRWVSTQVPTGCRMHLLSPNIRGSLLLLASGPIKCMVMEPPGAKSMSLDCLEIMH